MVAAFESGLHSYLADRLAGRVEVDVETATADEVLDRSRALFEEEEERRERETIERLDAGARAVAGLENVLPLLNERRVEGLLLDQQLEAPGALCPTCGLLWPATERRCPADGTGLETRDDITEQAIELALLQAADVLPMRRHVDELRARGGIAALLRF